MGNICKVACFKILIPGHLRCTFNRRFQGCRPPLQPITVVRLKFAWRNSLPIAVVICPLWEESRNKYFLFSSPVKKRATTYCKKKQSRSHQKSFRNRYRHGDKRMFWRGLGGTCARKDRWAASWVPLGLLLGCVLGLSWAPRRDCVGSKLAPQTSSRRNQKQHEDVIAVWKCLGTRFARR